MLHSIVYLACPYTDPSPEVRIARFHAATQAAASLVKQGMIVYSPITMTHPLDQMLAGQSTLGSEFWVNFDEAFMSICSEMKILKIDGWDRSSGIRRERNFFQRASRPVSFIDIDGKEIG